MIINLSKTEYQILNFIGALRFEATTRAYLESNKGLDRKQSTLNSLQMVIDGVISEYSVCKMMNRNFDLNCDYRKFGADLKTKDGLPIDIKSTRDIGKNFSAVLWSAKKIAEIYIGVELSDNYVNVIGWIKKEDCLIQEHIKLGQNGTDYYSIPQSKFKKVFNIK